MSRLLLPVLLIAATAACIPLGGWEASDSADGPSFTLADGDTRTFTITVGANADALTGDLQLEAWVSGEAQSDPSLDGWITDSFDDVVSDSASSAFDGIVELQVVVPDPLLDCTPDADGSCEATFTLEVLYDGIDAVDLSWYAEVLAFGDEPEEGESLDPQVWVTVGS